MSSRDRLPVKITGQTVEVSEGHIDFNVKGVAQLRDELREELDDLYNRPILKPTAGTDYAKGVGTPFLVEIQEDGIGPFILFTGWKTDDGSGREVFIGDIDENFIITNIRKIISIGHPNASFISHDVVHAIYNSYDKAWLLFTSSNYTLIPEYAVCLFIFNKDFTNELSANGPLLYSDTTIIRTTDCGFSPVRSMVNSLWASFVRMSGTTNYGLYGTYTPNFRAVPPVFQPPEKLFANGVGLGWYAGMFLPDVLHLVRWKEWMIILAEELSAFEYNIRVYFVHAHKDYTGFGATSFMGIAGRASENLIQPYGSYGSLHCGHPHLTWLPNRKLNLFYSIFPNWSPSFKHEIWCRRLPPERFDQKSYRCITYVPWYNDVIIADDASRAFPGYERKTIWFTSNVAGNLTIEVDPIGIGNWETFDTIPSTTTIQYNMVHSCHSIRLKFSMAATVTAVVVIEPYK